MGFVKGIFNAVADPKLFLHPGGAGARRLGLEARIDRRRMRSATDCSAFSALFFVFGLFDPNFRLIVTKPDNVPIVGLIFLLVFFTWYSMREAVLNDRRIAARAGADREGRVGSRLGLAGPGLHRADLADRLLDVVLIGWSILLKAPLEQPANPANTPNPSKAPWYFLGLQEMLVYFDPWLAGVVLPSLIIVGLICIPYIDKNLEGQRLLHVQRAEGGSHDLPVRLRDPVVVAHRARHVPARAELELLRAVRVLGHSQARGADQRQPVGYIWVRGLRTALADELARARDLRHRAGAGLRLRAAGDPSRRAWFKALLREAGRRRATTSACSSS